jgi:peptidoglycan/LPS O-acetylase OafA/YrhL
MKYRPYIDGLRAIAVLSVVSFHAFPKWMGGGFIGVDIFFVISGFLISTILFEGLEKGIFSFSDFYARRIRRIFPALILVLISCFAYGWFTLLPDEYMLFGKHMAGGAGFVSNFMFWNEAGYFDKVATTKPLLHLWSLGIEEQFYIIWPLLLWCIYKWRLNPLMITTIIALTSFALNLYSVKTDGTAAFYSPQTRFWELLSGSILAWLTIHPNKALCALRVKLNLLLNSLIYRHTPADGRNTLYNVQSILGFLLISYGLYRISKDYYFPGSWALIPVIGAVLIISAGSNAWLNRTLLSNKVLVWFGLISYPLYLWHWALLSFAEILNGDLLTTKTRLILVVSSVILAWLTYQLIEKPIRHGGHKKVKSIMPLVLMLIVGYIGHITYQMNGLIFRFPREVRLIIQATDFRWPDYIRNGVCHIQEMKSTKHDPVCYEITRPLIALWGDSHASSLYPGFKALQAEKGFGLIQLTQAGCGPIFDLQKFEATRENCNEVNSIILRELSVKQPDIIVLHGAWISDDFKIAPEVLRTKFTKTIVQIKSRLPNAKVVVIGPMPRWRDGPQKTSYLYWKAQLNKTKPIPQRQQAETLNEVDKILAEICHDNELDYISPIFELCNSEGCIARVGTTPETFIAVDYGHLSKAGSEYFIMLVKDILLNKG